MRRAAFWIVGIAALLGLAFVLCSCGNQPRLVYVVETPRGRFVALSVGQALYGGCRRMTKLDGSSILVCGSYSVRDSVVGE